MVEQDAKINLEATPEAQKRTVGVTSVRIPGIVCRKRDRVRGCPPVELREKEGLVRPACKHVSATSLSYHAAAVGSGYHAGSFEHRWRLLVLVSVHGGCSLVKV